VPSGRPVGRLRPADPIVDRPERLVSSRRKHPDGGRLPDRTSDHADVGRVRGSGGAAQRCMGWLLVHVLPPAPGSRRGAQSARPQPQPYVRPLSVEGAAQELRLLPGSTRGILRPVHVGRAPQEHTIIHSGQLKIGASHKVPRVRRHFICAPKGTRAARCCCLRKIAVRNAATERTPRDAQLSLSLRRRSTSSSLSTPVVPKRYVCPHEGDQPEQ